MGEIEQDDSGCADSEWPCDGYVQPGVKTLAQLDAEIRASRKRSHLDERYAEVSRPVVATTEYMAFWDALMPGKK